MALKNHLQSSLFLAPPKQPENKTDPFSPGAGTKIKMVLIRRNKFRADPKNKPKAYPCKIRAPGTRSGDKLYEAVWIYNRIWCPIKILAVFCAVPKTQNKAIACSWGVPTCADSLAQSGIAPFLLVQNVPSQSIIDWIYFCIYTEDIDITYGAHMSKTYSVREVAAALGMTQRGVVQRLNRNQLKGTKKTNQYGTPEWQVYATKEISMAIEALKNAGADPSVQQSFAPEADESYDAIDAEGVDVEETSDETNWIDLERKRLEMLAETLVKPLTEQLAYQAAALREKELELQEKDRQLRLLPDFQKQAEDRRQLAEAKELEAIALGKQIEAMKAKADENAAEFVRLNKIETETLPSVQRQLEVEREQKEKELAEAAAKVSSLEQAKEQAELAKRQLEESLQAEITRLRDEKEEQSKAIETKFDALNSKLEELQKPQPSWWQKFFGVQSEK